MTWGTKVEGHACHECRKPTSILLRALHRRWGREVYMCPPCMSSHGIVVTGPDEPAATLVQTLKKLAGTTPRVPSSAGASVMEDAARG